MHPITLLILELASVQLVLVFAITVIVFLHLTAIPAQLGLFIILINAYHNVCQVFIQNKQQQNVLFVILLVQLVMAPLQIIASPVNLANTYT